MQEMSQYFMIILLLIYNFLWKLYLHGKKIILWQLVVDILFFLFQPKGKQGTKGQKQIETENKTTLSFYLYIILSVNVSILITCTLYWVFKSPSNQVEEFVHINRNISYLGVFFCIKYDLWNFISVFLYFIKLIVLCDKTQTTFKFYLYRVWSLKTF